MVTTDAETSTAHTYMLYKTHFQILSAMDLWISRVRAHVLTCKAVSEPTNR
jgi:hypothetical protein